MKKKEIIWRDILHQAINNKKIDFTQKELAQKYGFSLSTVFNALKTPRESNAIEASGRGFKVIDAEKFLYLFATFRALKKDIMYKTYTPKTVQDIEGEMPPDIIFGAFSAYMKKYHNAPAPADYAEVYIYANKEQLKEIQNRFPLNKKNEPNLIVFLADSWLKNFGKTTPDVQTFADLWNLKEWYAKDFLNTLKEKLF